MFGLGFSEIMVLAVLGLILLGPEQLPEIARTLGRFINDLKRSTEDITEDFKKQGFGNSKQLLEDIRKETTLEIKLDDDKPEELAKLDAAKTEEVSNEHGKKPESN